MNSDMRAVTVCEAMRWPYDTYLDQPAFFIDLIIEKMRIDAKMAEKKNRS